MSERQIPIGFYLSPKQLTAVEGEKNLVAGGRRIHILLAEHTSSATSFSLSRSQWVDYF